MSVKSNIASNFVGRGWSLASSFIFVPLYIKFMGLEAYGLVGVYATLTSLVSVLDLGLSLALSRSFAELPDLPNGPQRMRNLLVSLEIIFWALAAIVGVVLAVAAPYIAGGWLGINGVSTAEATYIVRLMAISIFIQFGQTLYASGFIGLQRQVTFNVMLVIMSTLRNVGVLFILWGVSSNIESYFMWQIFALSLSSVVQPIVLRRRMPRSPTLGRFDYSEIARNIHFATRSAGINIIGTLLVHADKIVMSGVLSLSAFGAYTLSSNVALGLQVMIWPFYAGLFPRFAELWSRRDDSTLLQTYLLGSSTLAVAVWPAASTLVALAPDALFVWTGNAALSAEAAPITSLLVISMATNALVVVPYALQLASGMVKLSLLMTILQAMVYLPLLSIFGVRFGALGAALASIGGNITLLSFSVRLMHRRIFSQYYGTWLLSVVPAVLSSALCGGIAHYMFAGLGTRFSSLCAVCAAYGVTLVAAATLTPATRRVLVDLIRHRRRSVWG